MKKVLLVLSVAALTLTSCSKEEITDCNCGTVVEAYNASEGFRVLSVSDCDPEPKIDADGNIYEPSSDEFWIFDYIYAPWPSEGDRYCHNPIIKN